MQSAIGNFNNDGVAVHTPRTVEWCASKIVTLEDELERLRNTLLFRETVAIKEEQRLLNVLDYVSKDDWDSFCGLAANMLANGASLYELQQRLMGLT